MDKTSQTGSLADFVFSSLENDILTGVLRPDTALSENKLSTAMGVSRTPVREALRRLEQEGLIQQMPGRGMVVLGVSRHDLADIYEIRIRIEGLAARYAAESITEKQLKELQELVELQEFYAAKSDADRLRDTDSQFHAMLYNFCSSRILCETLTHLHHYIERYRRISMESSVRAEKMAAEHRSIVDALRDRNSALAEELTIQHITNARDAMQNVVQSLDAESKGKADGGKK